MLIFEILKGNELYETAHNAYNWYKSFEDRERFKELEQMLGFDIYETFIYHEEFSSTDRLSLSSIKDVPNEYIDEFESHPDDKYNEKGWVVSKENSILTKKFREFMKKYEIKVSTFFDLDNLIYIDDYLDGFRRIGDRYFAIYRSNIPEGEERLIWVRDNKCLKEIKKTEKEYAEVTKLYLDDLK